jgi:hypothetical protein
VWNSLFFSFSSFSFFGKQSGQAEGGHCR